MRLRAALVPALFVALVAGTAPLEAQSGGGGAEVRVQNNVFLPQEVEIASGEAVTWRFETAGHNVRSEDGLFFFDDGENVAAGQTREFVFPEPGVYRYYCTNHGTPGAGMWGAVYVDATIPTPEPTPTPEPPPTRHVPSEYPSLQAALFGAPAGTVIEIAPGTHTGGVRVTTADITIRGTGATPEEVVLDGTGRSTVITVSAPGVRVEHLTVAGANHTGIAWQQVAGFAAVGVRAVDNGAYGLSAVGSRRGTIRGVHASGAAEAGVSVRGCRDCDIVLEDVTAEGNGFGYAGIDTGAVTILGSTFRDNTAGVLLATLPPGTAPTQGTHLWGSRIEDNDRDPPAAQTELPRPPSGVGVWVAGARHTRVEGNTVTGHDRYGIAVTWLTAPSLGVRVIDNVVSGGGPHLAWDGLGVNVCFSGNRTPGGAAPASSPPGAQDLYPCSAPATAGVPNPGVLVDLLGASL